MNCKKHPKYGAILQPRVACDACWQMWQDKHRDRLIPAIIASVANLRADLETVYARRDRGWRVPSYEFAKLSRDIEDLAAHEAFASQESFD